MARSKAYSSRNVQCVLVERMCVGREGQRCHVGVDVGKADLRMVVRWADGVCERPVSVRNPGQVREAVVWLAALGEDRQLVVAMESSGTYGDALRQVATGAGLRVHRVSAKASHDYAQTFDGVASQHDGKDAAVIAELSAIGKSVAWPWVDKPQAQQRMLMHAELLDGYERQLTAWCNRIEGWLGRHWPEMIDRSSREHRLLSLRSPTLLKLLGHYGGPGGLAADAGAESQLQRWGGAMLKPPKIAKVMASARSTVGVAASAGSAACSQVQQYAHEALSARALLRRQRRGLEALGQDEARVRRLAPLTGVATACVLLARLGDPASYACTRAYLKALGLNMVERSSGQHVGQKHISKRAHPQPRRWLYFAAMRLVRNDPHVRRWYDRKVARHGARGKRPALVAVMRKLAQAIHRMAKDDAAFDSRRLMRRPQRSTAAEARAREVTMKT